MAWIILTEKHILDRFSEDERDSVESAGDQDCTTKRLPGIIDQITAFVRGQVAACSQNIGRMGPPGTIPAECVYHAATLARESLIATQPTLEGVLSNRERELNAANDYFPRVASCDVAIADDSGQYPGEPVSVCAAFGGKPLLEF